MPLTPGNYYLYIKFKAPTLKWEARSTIVDDKGVKKDAYYDLVADSSEPISTLYKSENWAATNDTLTQPAGYPIIVRDKQAPQAYFSGNAPTATSPNPNPADALPDGKAPASGIKFTGGTTGDPYPEDINFIVSDNNPNTSLKDTAKLKALLGKNVASLNEKEVPTKTISDSEMSFTRDMVEKVLLRTITPKPNAKAPGQVQGADPLTTGTASISQYPGYGTAPFRQAAFIVEAPPAGSNVDRGDLGSNDIPYDMVGCLPMYAVGADASGNIIGDANNNQGTDEINVARTKSVVNEAGKANEVECTNAPAYLTVTDNDAPTITFTALRSRDSIKRKYAINATGPDVKVNNNYTGHKGFHTSYNDILDRDPANPGKLKFKTFGTADAFANDFNLDNTDATIANQSNPLFSGAVSDINKHKQFTPLTNDPDIAIGQVDGQPGYVVKYNGKNVGISPLYDNYSPINIAYYDFDQIVKGSGGDTLELIEKSRTKFEITIADNVDGDITPSPCAQNATAMAGSNCYIDTKNLGDAETLSEVMNSWKADGIVLTANGQFRNPTLPANLEDATKPFMFLIAKDGKGNATVIKFPIVILHTLMRTNVLNVESRRSQ